MNQTIANEMLKNIPDPRMRQQYADILAGRANYRVYCLNPQRIFNAKGKSIVAHADKCAIGFVNTSGQVIDAMIRAKDGTILAGIESSRDRLDGRKGFTCYCGNTSIRSEEEQRILGTYKEVPAITTPPTREQLTGIFELVQKNNKGALVFEGGTASYDGFMLEEVKE